MYLSNVQTDRVDLHFVTTADSQKSGPNNAFNMRGCDSWVGELYFSDFRENRHLNIHWSANSAHPLQSLEERDQCSLVLRAELQPEFMARHCPVRQLVTFKPRGRVV